MCKCKYIYKYVLPIYENICKSCKCPHEFACLALEWAARYLGKDPSQLSDLQSQIASTCTSLLAKFEAMQFTTELLRKLKKCSKAKRCLLILAISCETAISQNTKCPGRTPHRPQDQFGAETCKAQLWIWKREDPSLGKWRCNCKAVSRWKVRFVYEACRYQWCLLQISNNTVASGFCVIHSGIHLYISCLDCIKLSFHPNPHPSQTYVQELSRDWASRETSMNHESSDGIESAQSTAFCILLQAFECKSLSNHPQPVPHCRFLTGQPDFRSCDFQTTSSEISATCGGGHAWMVNLVVLVNPVVGETERCQGAEDRSR